MKDKEIIGFIVGGFIVLILAGVGIFTGIIGDFVEGFGIGYGLILGVLVCLIIILTFLGIGGKK